MLRRSVAAQCTTGAASVMSAPRVIHVATCAVALLAVVGCAATGLTDPGTASPALGAASGASYSTQSTHEHDNREMVLISGKLPKQLGEASQLVATACEPLEHLQKATKSPCGTRWMIDSDAKLTWSSTNEDAATVDADGTVTLVSTAPYAIIAYSNDNGGACTAVGTQEGPVYYEVAWKKHHQHLSEKHRTRELRCDYREYHRYEVESDS